MTENDTVQLVSTAARIGLLGDLHGDMEHLLIVARTMAARDVVVLLQLGDFGFVWPRQNWGIDLSKIGNRLTALGQTLYFVDGNHEDFTRLYRHPVGPDGLRWLRPNIAHIPRGWRTTLASGKTLAVLGGANSVDVGSRVAGSSLWPEESITEDDLTALGNERANVMLGHDAPLHVPALDELLARTNHWWPENGRRYSAAGRAMFHRGYLQVRPELYLGGHYHCHIDQQVNQRGDDGTLFQSRVVVLDMNGSSAAISQAILNVYSLAVEFLGRDDRVAASGTN